MTKPPKFTIKAEWETYARLMFGGRVPLTSVQYRESRRVFYGAWGQCLAQMQTIAQELPEEIATNYLEAQVKEVVEFWTEQAAAQKGDAHVVTTDPG